MLPPSNSYVIVYVFLLIGIIFELLDKVNDKKIYLVGCDKNGLYAYKNENNEFRTLPTIFANAYKREDKYLLDTGSNYSRAEIELRAENMKQYYQDYRIDKKKRK